MNVAALGDLLQHRIEAGNARDDALLDPDLGVIAIENLCVDLVGFGTLLDTAGILPGFFGAYDQGFDPVVLTELHQIVGIYPGRFEDEAGFSFFGNKGKYLFETFGCIGKMKRALTVETIQCCLADIDSDILIHVNTLK